MKNLTKLGFIFSVGSLAAFAIGGCSDDTTGTTNTTGGVAAAGMPAGGMATAGMPTAGAGNSTGGTSAGNSTGGAGASTGGAGASTGGGGSGGASGGSGGKAAGGTGGTGGASGGTGGGGGSGGAAAPSADCTKWCSGAMGLPTKCTGSALLNPVVSTEEKCLAYCAKPAAAAGMTCWLQHLGFIAAPADQDPHCGHASGLTGKNGPCAVVAN